MATQQSLKGSPSKIYEIVNTFNKGYNTAVADDVLAENVFRNIVNFLPSEEGNITKRPGINRTNLYTFFERLSKNDFDKDKIELEVSGSTNDPDVVTITKQNIDYIFNNVFKMEGLVKSFENNIASFTPRTLSNFTILENNLLLNYAKNFEDLLDVENNANLYKDNGFLDFIIIFLGDYEETNPVLKTTATRIAKIKIALSYNKETDKYKITINYELRQPYRKSTSERLAYRYNGDDLIEFAIYANNYYYMNSYDAMVKISRDISSSTSIVSDSITEFNKESTELYKPTAVEITNIGFNIMAKDPLSYVDNQGTADTIRGVFFTYKGEPTQTVPYNKEFELHILSSGSSANEKPQYRPNNGEVDVTVNKYKDLPGSYNSDKSVFTCTGLNETGSFELNIKKGEDNYINYFTMGSVSEKEIGKIEDISKLVFSSRYCKVINSQLVLFGNHGYLFFSDYNKFNYFPNYYYVYAAETENEQVTGLTYFRQFYALFTNKRIKRLAGSFGSDDFGLYPLNDYIGCTNPKSIKQVQNYIYFLSYNGLYLLKQGYLGEGNENVEQIDLPIYKSYDVDSMIKAATLQNFYALYSKNGAILYNYINDAFYKLETAGAKYVDEETNDSIETSYSAPFQYNILQSYLFYGIKVERTVEAQDSVQKNKEFDICIQDYSEDSITRMDNNRTFISTFETPFMSLGTPTNTKKFKTLYLKLYNKNGLDVPLYITIKVDDRVVVSPTNYEITYDEDTKTYSYIEKTDSNKELKGYNVLGTLTLGEDILGERTLQILKMNIGAKGRAVKVILSDGLEHSGISNQNKYRFDLSTLGIVYKLKKVKEG
jgi:hypothetical protein